MTELHLPWLELAILAPVFGALWTAGVRDPEEAQRRSLIMTGAALVCAIGAWLDFAWIAAPEAHDRWSLVANILGSERLSIDRVSAPLLPMAALVYFVTVLATLRTKVRRMSFSGMLVAEALLLATFSCRDPWGVIALLALGVIPPLVELRSRGKPTRVFALHMAVFITLLMAGGVMAYRGPATGPAPIIAVVLLMAAVLIRNGVAPAHCWLTDLFEHATFGSALLFVTPMVGVYAKEARRFFCYVFLSHSSLVLVGLETATPIGLTGALCLWISVGLALTGFGLTLRAVESRSGRVSLADYHGLYDHMPKLATFFLLTGLASIGFPGTIGFVGGELLVEGVVGVYPFVGLAVVLAAALNGIAVMQAYFRVFTGKRHVASISLRSRWQEQTAVLVLAVLIVGGGLVPQPGLIARRDAADQILDSRRVALPAAAEANPDAQQQLWFADEAASDLKTPLGLAR
jgi:NADH-quinone oxidoreductase subunit M